MAKLALNKEVIRSATCPMGKLKVDIPDGTTPGLILEVRSTGGKTFYIRYRDKRGSQRQHSIGDANCINLNDARQAAKKLRAQVALGFDPAEERTTARQVPTFGEFMNSRYMPFVRGYKKSWKSDDSYLRNHLLPFFGKKHLDEISKHDVIAFHHGIRAKGKAVGTANRCLIMLRYALRQC